MVNDGFIRAASMWNSPEKLAQLVDVVFNSNPREELFNKPKYQPAREDWLAARFALGYQSLAGRPVQVRLSAHEGFPDFKLKVDGAEHDFENVMAITRRLGEEYRGDKGTGVRTQQLPDEVPVFDPDSLKQVVAKKVK